MSWIRNLFGLGLVSAPANAITFACPNLRRDGEAICDMQVAVRLPLPQKTFWDRVRLSCPRGHAIVAFHGGWMHGTHGHRTKAIRCVLPAPPIVEPPTRVHWPAP